MKKRIAKFVALFVMLILFGVIEDVLAAHVSGGTFDLIIEALPFIFLISVLFTLITEAIEEHFERGEGPLEKVVDSIIGKKKVRKKK
ncbi:MAG: hypothetical protein GOV02_03705 [Candidatus Aenigmarchaeota archaeon]|nr:hypothetical protein [Candidatus Aenigmarchaeota archaeon]